MTRRSFARSFALGSGAWLASVGAASAWARTRGLHLSCNQYVWYNFYEREKKSFADHLDQALQEMASVGLDGFEPSAGSPAEMERIAGLARKHGLEVRSIYVGSTLHDPAQVSKSVSDILDIARVARQAGARIVVTNPSPLQWGGPQNKDDAQLECQARAMDELGRKLSDLGLQLAYHNHDVELRQAGREFHHMLAATNPRWVHLCLDAHWVYRGAGHSQVALFDVVRLYGKRIIELHLRQSRGNIWTETLGEGDIDYARLVEALRRLDRRPLLVLEQAVEAGTPHTLNVVQAFQQTVPYVRRVFAPLA